MIWVWDWKHTVILLALIAATTVLVALGHGQLILQLVALASGGTGVVALFRVSPRQEVDVKEAEK